MHGFHVKEKHMKAILIIIILCISMSLMAQETPRLKEAGVVFRNLDNFGLTYRTGTEKALWRFEALTANLSNENREGDRTSLKNNQFSLSVRAGREYRRSLSQRFALRSGFDLGLGLNYSLRENDQRMNSGTIYDRSESTEYTGLSSLILGANLQLGKSWTLGAEIRPTLSFTRGSEETQRNYNDEPTEEETRQISRLAFGSNLTSIVFSAVYRL